MRPWEHWTYSIALAVLVSVWCVSGASRKSVLGVAPQELPRYTHDPFTCDHGKTTVPSVHINDNYCDCADGSDEPGTSACAHVSPRVTFLCLNPGHTPRSLPTSRVNDGLCDCCDGSDEYSGLVKCENTCLQAAKRARKAAKRKAKQQAKGFQLRMANEASGVEEQKARVERVKWKKHKLKVAKATETDLEREKNRLETQLTTIQRQFNESWKAYQKTRGPFRLKRLLKRLDKNTDGKLNATELGSRKELDRDKNGTVEDSEVQYYLSVGLGKVPTGKEKGKADSTKDQKGDSGTKSDSEPAAASKKPEDDATQSGDQHITAQQFSDHVWPLIEESLFRPPKYNQTVKDVMFKTNFTKHKYETAKNLREELEKSLKHLEGLMKVDVGPRAVHLHLQEVCFHHKTKEYEYRLCPYDKVEQVELKGSKRTTSLGRWKGWDGSGHARMLYDKGAKCHNGPARSVKVELTCGPEEIVSIDEPSRCEYHMVFRTSGVCSAPSRDASEAPPVQYDHPHSTQESSKTSEAVPGGVDTPAGDANAPVEFDHPHSTQKTSQTAKKYLPKQEL